MKGFIRVAGRTWLMDCKGGGFPTKNKWGFVCRVVKSAVDRLSQDSGPNIRAKAYKAKG